MNSTTKTPVAGSKVKEIIKHYYPYAKIDFVEELTGGMQNSAWAISLRNPLPQKLILKIGALPDADVLKYEKNNLYAEKEFYKMLKDENIPIPELLVFDDTKQFLESPFMIMTCLDGVSWRSVLGKISDENKRELLHELGKIQQ